MAYANGGTRRKSVGGHIRALFTPGKRAALRHIVPGWAVIVGINEYENPQYQSLQCCVADAIGLYILLTETQFGGFDPMQVRLLLDPTLTDKGVRAAVEAVRESMKEKYGFTPRPEVFDEILERRLDATKATIFKEIKRAADNCAAQEQLPVYFAGHGWVGDEGAYLLPPEAEPDIHEHLSVSLRAVAKA